MHCIIFLQKNVNTLKRILSKTKICLIYYHIILPVSKIDANEDDWANGGFWNFQKRNC